MLVSVSVLLLAMWHVQLLLGCGIRVMQFQGLRLSDQVA